MQNTVIIKNFNKNQSVYFEINGIETKINENYFYDNFHLFQPIVFKEAIGDGWTQDKFRLTNSQLKNLLEI